MLITKDNNVKIDDSWLLLPEQLDEAMGILHHEKIQSVVVEGGAKTLHRFLEADLWDEARVLTGNQQWGKGLPAPVLRLPPDKTMKISDNTIQYVQRHL